MNHITPTSSDIQFLMEASWNRIMWYRNEIWKVSYAIFSIEAASTVAILNLNIKSEYGTLLLITYIVVNIIILGCYYLYLDSLTKAAIDQNEVHQYRTRFYSELLSLHKTDGFKNIDTSPDTRFQYLKFPSLLIILPLVAVTMFLLNVMLLYVK